MQRRMTMMALCLTLTALSAHAREAASTLVYIGTRAAAQDSALTQGIYAARFDASTGQLTALGQQANIGPASWLVTHPSLPVIYTVSNLPDANRTSNLYSFAVDASSGKLRQINMIASGALDTTQLAFDGRSNTLLGAAFISGEVTASPILADGAIGPMVSSLKHSGSGPHPRQASPHAHAVALDPTGRYVASADMGADRIFVHRFDAATRTLTPAATPFVSSASGTGPRHLTFHPNGRFVAVNTELTAEVQMYRWDARQGTLQRVDNKSAYPDGYTGAARSSAEIGFAKNGRTVYVSLRGDQDSIVAYQVNPRSGQLTEIQRLPVQGKSPRSFAIDPTGRWMLVANELSNAVRVFGINRRTGKLVATDQSITVPNPAAFTFYPE